MGGGGKFLWETNMVTTDLILKGSSAEEVSTTEILKLATPPGWDTNEIKELYTSTTSKETNNCFLKIFSYLAFLFRK